MKRIRRLRVSTGINWIEIAEADVRILGACPENSVKHLKRQGLIALREENGVKFESGPNVLLMSDLAIQNGYFANLSEFPILQMLYMQGMLIPNHPNNTGDRPIVLGSRQQLDAQMDYFYRGNYGLISEEELMEAGLSKKEAKEQMRMKLRYAFGSIRRPEDLVCQIPISSEPTEVKNGVFVKRLKLNVFEISYKDESTTVDLNLRENETYEPPYLLGTYTVKREYFGILHSGEGDGWDFNRPCMSSILMYQGRIYLIDAGPNIIHSLHSLGIGVEEIEGIFHTHGHDDHFAGLTTLMRADHKIKYLTSSAVRHSVFKKLAALLSVKEEKLLDFFDVIDLKEGEWNNIDGLDVKPVYSPHPVETNIFHFRAVSSDGYKTYTHLADISSFDVLKNMIVEDKTSPGISKKMFKRTIDEYLKPSNIKKIDCGGGMIHGSAEDFVEDKSDKLIISHLHVELTARQKEIGSGAPFGSVEALIPSIQQYVWRDAYLILRSYFPTAPEHEVKALVNSEIECFNPESIIYQRGQKIEDVYLLLTGTVEMIQHGKEHVSTLSSGAFIGDSAILRNAPITDTYRAFSSAQVLKIGKFLFLDFLKANGLEGEMIDFMSNREFLQKTWLFGDGISFSVLNKIARNATLVKFKKGETVIEHNSTDLMIVKKGSCQRMFGEMPLDVLCEGEFFCEELAILQTQPIAHFETLEETGIYKIPTSVLKEIPVVNWKLFEIYSKRKTLATSLPMG